MPARPEFTGEPTLEWRCEARERTINDYGPDEPIPSYVEYYPGPGQYFLDGEPISDEEAERLLAEWRATS